MPYILEIAVVQAKRKETERLFSPMDNTSVIHCILTINILS
jgi:hypothetical protein